MTTGAGRLDGRFGVRVLLVAVAFVAFDAASLWRFFALRDAVIGVLHVDAAGFIRRVRVIRPFVAVQTLLHWFYFGVLVGVVTLLAIRRVFRLYMVSVIEVFDDAPLGMLTPLIALFRIA